MKDKVKKGLILAAYFLLMSVTGVQAQDFCEGNFDYDKDVDGSDAALFKTDFGRSNFKNPCPPDGPAPVPKTGQTKCYDSQGMEIVCQMCIPPHPCIKTGQDGNWRKGAEWPNPRFTDNGNGTVTDNLTGLIWLKHADCFGARSWQLALDDCNNLSDGLCNLTDGSNVGDWRLPNLFELGSLRDMKYYGPALSNTAGTGGWSVNNPFFIMTEFPKYWTSTSDAFSPGAAWYVRMFDGEELSEGKTVGLHVWPVRGGH